MSLSFSLCLVLKSTDFHSESTHVPHVWCSKSTVSPCKITLNSGFTCVNPSFFLVKSPFQLGFNRAPQVAANLITYSAAISACGRGTEWQQALQLLARLPELELRINVMLDGC
jgi:pentatricopeptide repeat protein